MTLYNNFKNAVGNVLLSPLMFGFWCCWFATSLGVPFLVSEYEYYLAEKQGLSTLESQYIIASTIFGPFSIPISLIHACSKTIEYLRN